MQFHLVCAIKIEHQVDLNLQIHLHDQSIISVNSIAQIEILLLMITFDISNEILLLQQFPKLNSIIHCIVVARYKLLLIQHYKNVNVNLEKQLILQYYILEFLVADDMLIESKNELLRMINLHDQINEAQQFKIYYQFGKNKIKHYIVQLQFKIVIEKINQTPDL